MKKRIAVIAIGLILVLAVAAFGRVFIVRTIEESYSASPVNLKAGEISGLSGIRLSENIFGLNEDKIIRKIESAFPDRSVRISAIERVFPDKVIIHITERTAIAAVAVKDNPELFALADIDFQLDKTAGAEEAENLIKISGVYADMTFNTPVFAAVREIFIAFTELDVPYYALPSLLQDIAYAENSFTVNLKDGRNFSLSKNAENFRELVKELYRLAQ